MCKAGWRVAKKIAEKSIVLLKNSNHVLPLDAGEGDDRWC